MKNDIITDKVTGAMISREKAIGENGEDQNFFYSSGQDFNTNSVFNSNSSSSSSSNRSLRGYAAGQESDISTPYHMRLDDGINNGYTGGSSSEGVSHGSHSNTQYKRPGDEHSRNTMAGIGNAQYEDKSWIQKAKDKVVLVGNTVAAGAINLSQTSTASNWLGPTVGMVGTNAGQRDDGRRRSLIDPHEKEKESVNGLNGRIISASSTHDVVHTSSYVTQTSQPNQASWSQSNRNPTERDVWKSSDAGKVAAPLMGSSTRTVVPALGRAGCAASDGEYERKVISSLCEPGGLKAVPTESALNTFLSTAGKLPAELIGESLIEQLNSDHWQSRNKALIVIESLSSAVFNDHAVWWCVDMRVELLQSMMSDLKANVRVQAEKTVRAVESYMRDNESSPTIVESTSSSDDGLSDMKEVNSLFRGLSQNTPNPQPQYTDETNRGNCAESSLGIKSPGFVAPQSSDVSLIDWTDNESQGQDLIDCLDADEMIKEREEIAFLLDMDDGFKERREERNEVKLVDNNSYNSSSNAANGVVNQTNGNGAASLQLFDDMTLNTRHNFPSTTQTTEPGSITFQNILHNSTTQNVPLNIPQSTSQNANIASSGQNSIFAGLNVSSHTENVRTDTLPFTKINQHALRNNGIAGSQATSVQNMSQFSLPPFSSQSGQSDMTRSILSFSTPPLSNITAADAAAGKTSLSFIQSTQVDNTVHGSNVRIGEDEIKRMSDPYLHLSQTGPAVTRSSNSSHPNGNNLANNSTSSSSPCMPMPLSTSNIGERGAYNGQGVFNSPHTNNVTARINPTYTPPQMPISISSHNTTTTLNNFNQQSNSPSQSLSDNLSAHSSVVYRDIPTNTKPSVSVNVAADKMDSFSFLSDVLKNPSTLSLKK